MYLRRQNLLNTLKVVPPQYNYVAFFDASKAFVKISHWTLFRKLIDRGVSLHLAVIVCYRYQKQEMTVRWGACISDSFKVTNGFRQGGILSPQIFNIYIDGLSIILNKSSIGWSIDGKRINHMLYRPISQTMFMLSIAINRAEHVCATVIIKHNYMLMCNHKIVINIMLCLVNSTGHI